jgi:hypothetical protein
MSRIRVALGGIEIEYEGEQSFIEDSLLTLAERLISMNGGVTPLRSKFERTDTPKSDLEASTNTIAQIIVAKTGTDLALAAVAKINIVRNIPAASRQEILEEMKQATTYYKDTYASNLSSYLNTLVRSRKVNLVSRATYALAAAERAKLEGVLASAP